MKQPKPWFRKQTGCWYVQVGSRQINLGTDRRIAKEKYHALMADRQELGGDTPVEILLDRYLVWCEKHRAASTFRQHKFHLQSFADHIGPKLKLWQLKPYHVTSWIDEKYDGRSASYRHYAIRTLQRSLNWAAKEKYIRYSPLTGIEKPRPTPRDTYLEPSQWEALLAEVRKGRNPESFLDLLQFFRNTGCRPQEARTVEARHFEERNKCIVFERALSKGEIDRRVVPLNSAALEIVTRLAAKHPTGPLLRNAKGRPWTRHAINCRFDKLKAKLGFYVCAYSVRHSFATDAIERGVDIITIATLMGHRNLTMLNRVYQHVNKKGKHLRDAMKKATGEAHATASEAEQL